MFLEARRRLWVFEPNDRDRSSAVQEVFSELEGFSRYRDDPVISSVSAEVGYWRKANAIHKWFVDNVQNGIDDCGQYSVTREKLEELQTLCKTALNLRDRGDPLLPTQSGFFFGSTSYDDLYYQDLEQTIGIIDSALKLDERKWDFFYSSSW